MFDRYPFLIASFPTLEIGVKPDLSFAEAKDLLAHNLNQEDAAKVKILFEPIDLDNIRALWLGLPLNERGAMNAKDLEEALLVRDSLPPYLVDFLERYDTLEERLHNFSSLYASLYREVRPKVKGFLRAYFQFERELRLVLVALRAKQMGRDVIRELQFEDPNDPFAAQILAQRDSPDYTPPQEFEDLKRIFKENSNNPMKLHQEILEFRFNKILELEEKSSSFSIDRILGFLARLMIVETWELLDREKGLSLIDDISKSQ